MRACTHCGCQGHGQTWAVRCSVCGEIKYPTMTEKPGFDWTCALCRATPPETRENRRAGAAKRVSQKARQTAPLTPGEAIGPKPDREVA